MVKSHGQGNLDLAVLYVLFDVGLVLAAPREDIYSGLWGYNSCLSCIAIGGVFYGLTWQSHLLAITCGRSRNNTFTLLSTVSLLHGHPFNEASCCFSTFSLFLCVHDFGHFKSDVHSKYLHVYLILGQYLMYCCH